jgi:hypothetical protein
MQRLQKRRAAAECGGQWVPNEIAPGEIYAEDVPLGSYIDALLSKTEFSVN